MYWHHHQKIKRKMLQLGNSEEEEFENLKEQIIFVCLRIKIYCFLVFLWRFL